jgi:hypothetical protein
LEFRYVYRRVEDVIGSHVAIADSPHGRLAKQLRYAYREHRDVARYTEATALCLASLGGNRAMDVSKLGSEVSRLLDKSFDQRAPYMKSPDDKPAPDKSSYDEYFEQLAAFTDELNRSKADKARQAAEMTASAEKT